MGQINNSGVINVNVGDLPAGVYVVIIESSKGLLRQRFVKL
ncbi:MAG: T9SS type A sorting domain-containing protein [Bacteroidetes bacterium]|nr:T9SS type A sorting domain-containing protein [Bacteroidota bacterium]